MIEPLNITHKEDHPDKITAVQGMEGKYYVAADEFNAVVEKANELAEAVNDIPEQIASVEETINQQILTTATNLQNEIDATEASLQLEIQQSADDLTQAIQDAINALVDNANVDYNTLHKLQVKLQAVEAIINAGGSDSDSVVNTVSELLQVFASYPEGVDLITLLAGKVNTADVVNNLNQSVAGKVLDAMQGKVLNDAIAALTTTVNAKLTGTLATDGETQITGTVTEDNKFVSRLKLYNWSVSTTFQSRIRAIALTGLSVATVAVVSATDSILSAIGKLQAQISNKAVATDYASSPTDVAKLPTIASLIGWKNILTFWKSDAFAGTGSRMVQVASDGSMSASIEVVTTNLRVQDNDIISPATAATYNSGNNYTAIITPLNSKTFFEGQYFFSGNYKYEAESNNTVRRIVLG